jgi:hypothetical protein
MYGEIHRKACEKLIFRLMNFIEDCALLNLFQDTRARFTKQDLVQICLNKTPELFHFSQWLAGYGWAANIRGGDGCRILTQRLSADSCRQKSNAKDRNRHFFLQHFNFVLGPDFEKKGRRLTQPVEPSKYSAAGKFYA